MHQPDPTTLYPLPGMERLVFLRNTIHNPNIIVGDYTYFDDPHDPLGFERRVLYHFEFIGDRLIIGKFCSIASEVTFIMNGANHDSSAISTYPFGIFPGWEAAHAQIVAAPNKGDTVIGNDVWIGYGATFLPGVHVGDGAVIASKTVVTRHVAPYTVVGGNPGREIRPRFPQPVIRQLLADPWWDWPIERITANVSRLALPPQ